MVTPNKALLPRPRAASGSIEARPGHGHGRRWARSKALLLPSTPSPWSRVSSQPRPPRLATCPDRPAGRRSSSLFPGADPSPRAGRLSTEDPPGTLRQDSDRGRDGARNDGRGSHSAFSWQTTQARRDKPSACRFRCVIPRCGANRLHGARRVGVLAVTRLSRL